MQLYIALIHLLFTEDNPAKTGYKELLLQIRPQKDISRNSKAGNSK